MAMRRPLTSCCPWFIRSCEGSRRSGWHMRNRDRHSTQRRWCMRRMFGSSMASARDTGMAGATSSRPPPKACRAFLIERARSKRSEKHGGGMRRVDLDNLQIADETRPDELLMLDRALGELERHVLKKIAGAGKVAVLCRADASADCRSTGYSAPRGRPAVDTCPGLAVPADDPAVSPSHVFSIFCVQSVAVFRM